MSFASALTQALNIFSVVIDQALCIFGEKSAWGKKSAWEPDSQDPAYYAGPHLSLLYIQGAMRVNDILQHCSKNVDFMFR